MPLAELTSKTVTVTLGEPTVDYDEDAPAEVCAPPPTPADTHTVVVDVNPKLPKEFVVASGSTASEISNSLTEANMAAAHEFIREVEEKKKKISESDTTSQPAVISAGVVEELRVSEELPAIPLSLSTSQNNEEVSAWWLAFIVIEFLVLKLSGHHERFALNDSITSICAGMLSQCFKWAS
ncbi:unnamed protein product [Heligmosomoides polygyrus]|uniref:Uncharacterized protein n=1 Tax=Heligmosomoides polygyrus TaxID=6339 RepID=A0A3P8CX78_HELPZ|nr:unnamed protein product [Heligmosomoides polygyrus]